MPHRDQPVASSDVSAIGAVAFTGSTVEPRAVATLAAAAALAGEVLGAAATQAIWRLTGATTAETTIEGQRFRFADEAEPCSSWDNPALYHLAPCPTGDHDREAWVPDAETWKRLLTDPTAAALYVCPTCAEAGERLRRVRYPDPEEVLAL